MIEVFKTNVTELDHANMLIDQILICFNGYTVNFDLEDCDRILRVECLSGRIHSERVITLLETMGFEAAILADDLQPVI